MSIGNPRAIRANLQLRGSYTLPNSTSRRFFKRLSTKLVRASIRDLIAEQLASEEETFLADWDEAILEDIERFLRLTGGEVDVLCDCAICMPDAPWNEPEQQLSELLR